VGLSLFKVMIVSVIYILANVYLAVVPLFDMLLPNLIDVAVVAS
jgi:hypothetical protein